MRKPLVSCLCPTYGRFPDYGHLLSETVESFRRQDYPEDDRELVILNDCPAQKLTCDVPGVRIVNLDWRASSLGVKFNILGNAALGEIFLPWEDDDISLPGRISQAVRFIQGFDYWNPGQVWFYAVQTGGPEGSGLHKDHNPGVCHHASAVTKELWHKAGGYPAISGAQDAHFDRLCRQLGKVNNNLIRHDPSQWQYIYRWGVSNCHLSGQSNSDEFYKRWETQPITEGTFQIEPYWREDYASLCAAKSGKAKP